MNHNLKQIQQAKKSFNQVLAHPKYADIIKDDKHLELLLELLAGNNFRGILDIGTGTGYLAFPLAEMFPDAKVYAIDIADAIIEKNRIAVVNHGISNLTFQSFDGLRYPFADESFDLIVSRYAFHHFPDAAGAVRQMYGLLKPGGRVLISDPMKRAQDSRSIIDEFMQVKKDGHIQFYSADELEELFLQAGFIKEKQMLTDMKFPFAPRAEYLEVYNNTSEVDRQLYDIVNENGIIWVKQINVGNTIFIKKNRRDVLNPQKQAY